MIHINLTRANKIAGTVSNKANESYSNTTMVTGAGMVQRKRQLISTILQLGLENISVISIKPRCKTLHTKYDGILSGCKRDFHVHNIKNNIKI